ncbi:MAG: haloalkane dehalogenase [Pseudomonadota bacterium]
MEYLRTPEERFEDLPDFNFAPNYTTTLTGYEGLRVHYIDEGDVSAKKTFLCLHGQPTWSYLYRKMIPVFLAAGHRVVVPDLLGFGKSDKPCKEETYTFDFHRDMLFALVKALDLKNLVLVCQDWGGIIGLTLPPSMSDRFSQLIVMNTAFPVGESLGQGFAAWKAYNREQPDLKVGELMQRATPGLSDEEALAYDAPFPDARYKAGVRRFPELVMIEPGMAGIETVRKARDWWSTQWSGQSFMAIGMADPVLGSPIMASVHNCIRGCPAPLELHEAGHFVQEHGENVATAALAYLDKE